MKRTNQTTIAQATLLTEASPKFVSLVDHGANQTPFKVVKRNGVRDNPELEMKTTELKQDERTVDVARISFPAESFKTLEDVNFFLTEKGFTAEVVEADGAYYATAENADTFGELEEIVHRSGAVFFVGTPTAVEKTVEDSDAPANAGAEATAGGDTATQAAGETTAKEEEEEPESTQVLDDVLKGAGFGTAKEITAKYDDWQAWTSDGTTIAEVLDDANDGLPPGIWEVNDAFYRALRTALMNGGGAKEVGKLTKEFGAFITRIVEAVYGTDGAQKEDALKALRLEAGTTPDEPTPTENTAKAAAETEAPATATKDSDANTATKDDALVAQLAEVVKEAIAPMEATVEKLQAELAAFKTAASKQDDRMDALEGRTARRKSVDADEPTTEPTAEQKAVDARNERATANLRKSLGMR